MKKFLVVFAAVLMLSLFVSVSAQAACTQAIPTSYKSEILQGTHGSGDTYKIAVYTSSATYDSTTTAYSATNEVSGTGYSAGGATLSGFSVTTSGTTAMLTFNNVSWSNATITSATCYVIYNSSKSNKAVYVGTFSSTSSTNGTFTITFPAATSSTALIRFN